MKILDVRFKNLNTLLGEWEIHFDRSPLKEAGLFAITGPNGSGKSTILDAISLALYGRTTRLDQPGKHIVTRGASDGFASVTVMVNGAVYQSSWSASVADGAVDTQMVLTESSEGRNVLENGVHTVPAAIAELTGLDFKRFCRSIMLAQGEFAAFLKALDNERIDTLEKIMGREFQEEASKEAMERAAVEAGKLSVLSEELDNLSRPSVEEKRAVKPRMDQLRREMEEALRLAALYEAHQASLRQRRGLDQRIGELAGTLASAHADRERLEPDIRRLQKTEKAADLSGDLNRLRRMEADRNNTSKRLDELRSDGLAIARRIDALSLRKSEVEELLDAAKSVWMARKDKIGRALERQQEIMANQQNLEPLLKRLEKLGEDHRKIARRQAGIGKELSGNRSRQRDMNAWLESHSVDRDLDTVIPGISRDLSVYTGLGQRRSALLTKRKAALGETKKALASASASRRATERAEKQLSSLKAKRKTVESAMASHLGNLSPQAAVAEHQKERVTLAAYRRMIKIARSHQTASEGRGEALEQDLVRARASAKAVSEGDEANSRILAILQHAIHRGTVGDGPTGAGVCPVCGSDHCPMKGEGPTYENDIRAILKDHAAGGRERAKRKRDFDRRIRSLSRKIAQLETMETSWEQLLDATGVPAEIDDIRSVQQAMETLEKSCRELKKRARKVDRMRKRISRLDGRIARETDSLGKSQTEAARLEKDADRHRDEAAALASEAGALEEREAKTRDRMAGRLAPYHEQLSPSEGAEALIDRLERRRDEYKARTKQAGVISREAEGLRSEEAGLPEALRDIDGEMEALKGEAASTREQQQILQGKQDEDYGSGDPAAEKRSLESRIEAEETVLGELLKDIESAKRPLDQSQQQMLEDTLAQLDRECESSRQALEGEARTAGFRDLQEAVEGMLSPEDQSATRQAAEETGQRIQQTQEGLARLREELAHIQVKPLPEGGDGEKAPGARERVSTLRAELTEAARRLDDLEKAELSYRGKEEALAAQRAICDEVEADRDFYESASAGEVRRRIRTMMLDRLVARSNQHLDALSGRYHLCRLSGEEELKLEIVDLRPGKEQRSLDTLSGGESFLVSLSMALGLADLAGSGRTIQTLFIDEGFGRLDDEALYNVLAILKNLKSGGKMVGVISHIQRLADEIPTQIRLAQTADGSSRMEIVA